MKLISKVFELIVYFIGCSIMVAYGFFGFVIDGSEIKTLLVALLFLVLATYLKQND